MEDAEGVPPSKKRVAGRQLTKDNPDDDTPESEMGTFQRASEEVLAARRIVKVRRHPQQSTSCAPNPFASIQLVPPTDSGAKTTIPIVKPQVSSEKQGLEEEDANKEKQDENGDAKETEAGSMADNSSVTVEEKKTTEEQTDAPITEVDNQKASEGEQEKQTEKVGVVEGGEEEAHKEDAEGACVEGGQDTEKAIAEVEINVEDANKDTEKGDGKESQDGYKTKTAPLVPFSSFQQLSSSQNAFTGLAGTGFSSSSFSFGPTSNEGSVFGKGSGPTFEFKSDNSLFSFGKGNSNSGISSSNMIDVAAKDGTANGLSGKASMQEVSVETGEENEESVFTADAILFEYIDGAWKERGKGELKVNVTTTATGKARLVMRARGNYRLILNASLYPDMSFKNMEKKGITFACINSAGDGKDALATFALKFRDSSTVEEFHEAVTAHKGKKDSVLKTPENSPKASED